MILPAMLFAMWAQAKVNSAFREFSQVRTYYGMTGYEAARRVLDAHGLRNVQIQMIQGNLTDHYDPRTNTISLSQDVYGMASVAAIGVAAHEAGHAVQYAEGYAPIKRRNAIIPITQIGSSLSWPLILIGLILGSSSLISFGIILFSLVTLFQLLTLPVEFDAPTPKRSVEGLLEPLCDMYRLIVGSNRRAMSARASRTSRAELYRSSGCFIRSFWITSSSSAAHSSFFVRCGGASTRCLFSKRI